MATGIDLEEHYEEPGSMYWRYAEAVGYYPGSGSPVPARSPSPWPS